MTGTAEAAGSSPARGPNSSGYTPMSVNGKVAMRVDYLVAADVAYAMTSAVGTMADLLGDGDAAFDGQASPLVHAARWMGGILPASFFLWRAWLRREADFPTAPRALEEAA